jgi:dolichol-phosphate mannosyltransferase
MKALIIVPTYNERGNIEVILPRILQQAPSFEALVVDDNSPDGTGDVVEGLASREPRIHLLRRRNKRGLGSAYLAGFRWALARDYEFIFEMDADLSHDPDDLPRLLAAATESDLVIGSRYSDGVNVVNWPISRLILSYGANLYTRVITGMPIRDATGGFKCFRRRALEVMNLDDIQSDGYSFQIEVNYKCWRRGLTVEEVPIVFTERRVGTSKMSRAIIREAVFMVWRLRWWGMFNRGRQGSRG